jgi:membrane protein YdbS with pleckstrin-like domain
VNLAPPRTDPAHGPAHDPGGPAPRLRPPHHRVDPRALRWWTLRNLVVSLGALAVLGALAWWWQAARPWLLAPAVVVGLWALARVAVEPRWRYAVHRWEATDDAVYGLTGWVVREWRVAPLSRVQTVDAVRGPREQVLGLATLRVTTASSTGTISIVGLDRQVAADLAERLTLVVERTPGDAT